MRTASGKDWIRESTRQAIYLRDGHRCIVCDGGPLSLDHVTPGAGNGAANLVTLCSTCNREKHERTVEEWRPELAARVRRQCALPLDRKEGGRLAKIARPARYAQEEFRRSPEGKRLAAERKAIREASVGGEINMWALAEAIADHV